MLQLQTSRKHKRTFSLLTQTLRKTDFKKEENIDAGWMSYKGFYCRLQEKREISMLDGWIMRLPLQTSRKNKIDAGWMGYGSFYSRLKERRILSMLDGWIAGIFQDINGST
jgi:hypothetical protein